jgi:ATP-binding cassette subfamily C (CFTR/MRP) protein 1
LIGFTEGDEELWKGIFYAVILFSTALVSVVLHGQNNYIMYRIGVKIRTSLISAIYRKALVLSNAAKRKSTVGEIVNLMSVDVQKITDLIPFLSFLWSAPFQIGLATYFLWGVVGPSALAGLGVMFLMVPLNIIIASKSKKWQTIQMKKKDKRIKMMNEILSGIKVSIVLDIQEC